jgi:hypothetical protein
MSCAIAYAEHSEAFLIQREDELRGHTRSIRDNGHRTARPKTFVGQWCGARGTASGTTQLRPNHGRQPLTPQPGPKRGAYLVSAFALSPGDGEDSLCPSRRRTLPV